MKPPTDTEDLVVTTKEMLIERQGERQSLINQLDAILQADIAIIIDEIHEIAVEIKEPKYLDASNISF